MPTFVSPDGREVNVSGEEEVARFEASGFYRRSSEKAEPKKAPAKKAAAKPSEK